MPRVVAIALPPGPDFVRELQRVWDDGDAALPLDPRLPPAAVEQLLDGLRPALVVDPSGSRRSLEGAWPADDGDALVVTTSGTTGAAKGVVLTHDAVRASAEASSRRLEVDPRRDVWLSLLPVAHIGGLSVLTRALASGTRLTFDPEDPDASLVSVVPTQANRLDLSRFRAVLVGGSSDWRARPANVVRTYGMTETGSGIAYDGRALDGVETRVDASGEIHLRGPMLLRAYRNGIDPKVDGWLPTGDSGRLIGDRLHVDGRIGDVIVTGGEKVWPGVVETALRTHEGVADVAVAGRPDDEWGQRVIAWVIAADPVAPPAVEALRDHVKSTLPAYAAPREMRLVESFPRTPSGKVVRELLPDRR